MATALKRKLWICTSSTVFLFNEEGASPPFVFQFGNGHYENVVGFDEHKLEEHLRKHKAEDDPNKTLLRGGAAFTASLRLSDFASDAKPRSSDKKSIHSNKRSVSSLRLTDFATNRSCSTRRSSNKQSAKQACLKLKESFTWNCDTCATVIAADSKQQLSAKRRNHIYVRHKHVSRSCFHQIKKTYDPITVLPKPQVPFVGNGGSECLEMLTWPVAQQLPIVPPTETTKVH